MMAPGFALGTPYDKRFSVKNKTSSGVRETVKQFLLDSPLALWLQAELLPGRLSTVNFQID